MHFLGSHVIHFVIMGLGISLVLGLLTPTQRPARTRMSILKHVAGFLGIGIVLAWIMYFFPGHPVRF
nr:hypothetical protein [uncultured Holophaga sp.]